MLKGEHMKAAENQFLPFLEGKNNLLFRSISVRIAGGTFSLMSHSNEIPIDACPVGAI
jgi:hypothetical protein